MDSRDEFNDELLSAYLDDQLSPGERASVEARLAEDDQARELVRELRAAAEAVRELPKAEAPRDLKAAILRAAEEVHQRENGVNTPAVAVATSRFAPSIGRTKRGWVWAALAVAAALMIMFFDRGEPEGPKKTARRSDQKLDSGSSIGPPAELADVEEAATEATGLERNNALKEESLSVAPNPTEPPIARSFGRDALADADKAGQSDEKAVELNLAEAESEQLREANAPYGYSDEIAVANGPVPGNERYFKHLREGETPAEEVGVVVSNAEAAFGDAVQVIQSDVPVYFVSVNVTAEAAENNVVTNFLGRNDISLVSQGPVGGALPVQLRAEQPIAEQEARRMVGLGAAARPEPLAQQSGSVSGIIAVEAQPEQIAALLNDMASDRQNVTAVAVLGEVGAAQAVAPLQTPEKYNRNADEAVGQVAGNWRFDTTGEAVEPVRVQRYAVPGGNSELFYGGGYGGGGGRGDAEALVEPAAGADNQAPGEVAGVAADSFGANRFRMGEDARAREEAPAPAIAENAPKSSEQLVQAGTKDKETGITGQAWVVSPLQVRTAVPAELSQQLLRQRFNWGAQVPSQAAAGAAGVPAEGVAEAEDAALLPGVAEAKQLDDVKLQTATDQEIGQAVADNRGLGEVADGQQPPALQPSAPPKDAVDRTLRTAEEARQDQPTLSGRSGAVARGGQSKPVRVVLFFNVIPTEQAAAAAAPATEPAPQAVPNE